MRISDWSSDVCSSDLATRALRNEATAAARAARTVNDRRAGLNQAPSAIATRNYAAAMERARVAAGNLDRKSVVSGKSVTVRVELGGRRIITKKKKKLIQ